MNLIHDVPASIGIVGIGRNEGERLHHCLRSVVAADRPVVYVDSGSSDDSVAFARSLGVDVVELDQSVPFTAALARNAGWRRLLELAPDVEFIQFVDGDCEVVRGWLEAATDFLRSNPKVAVVCGRRREIDAMRNRYHRLADMEWDSPIGEAKYCGGDAMIRTDALRDVNGYRDSLIAGEEPELCVRLRKEGWKIWRLDHEMTLHDIRMDSWRQWCRRAVRSGHAYAEGAALHGAMPERHWAKERRSIWVWGVIIPLASVCLAWPTRGLSLLAALGLFFVLFLRTYRSRRSRRNDTRGNAALYAGMCIAAKLPQVIGLFTYLWNQLVGSRATIIEYEAQPQKRIAVSPTLT